MKIKVMLVTSEDVHALPAEVLGVMGLLHDKPLEAYVELETGTSSSIIYSSEVSEHVIKGTELVLGQFGRSVLAAMEIDEAMVCIGKNEFTATRKVIDAVDRLQKTLALYSEEIKPFFEDR